MKKIPTSLLVAWEKDFHLLLDKEYEDAMYRLLKHNKTEKYQVNRYFQLQNPYSTREAPKWQVSVDLKDASAEEVIRYFWENVWYVPLIKKMEECLGIPQ